MKWVYSICVEGELASLLLLLVTRGVSSSAIGPLLNVMVPTAVNGNVLHVLATLLGDLLKSVRAEEEVVLTANQRHLLHELMIKGRWDWVDVRNCPGIGQAECCALRPPAISALAVIGNSSSIPVLERFATKTDDQDLQQSALHSIEQIRERLRYGPEQMLRGSKPPERLGTLLRAALADNPQNHDPQQLLRADNTDTQLKGKSATGQTEEQAASAPNVVVHGMETK